MQAGRMRASILFPWLSSQGKDGMSAVRVMVTSTCVENSYSRLGGSTFSPVLNIHYGNIMQVSMSLGCY